MISPKVEFIEVHSSRRFNHIHSSKESIRFNSHQLSTHSMNLNSPKQTAKEKDHD